MSTLDEQLAAIRARLERDEWCRNEKCRHRAHSSGSMPTHKRCEECPDGSPPPPFTKDDGLAVLAAVDAVLALHAPSDFPERTQFVASSNLSTASHVCRACDPMDEYPVEYPCPTVRAITEALGVTE
jgi:hypothetical protein